MQFCFVPGFVLKYICNMTKNQKIRNARNLILLLLPSTIMSLSGEYAFVGIFFGVIIILLIYDLLRTLGINRKTKFKIIWDKNPPKFLQKFFNLWR